MYLDVSCTVSWVCSYQVYGIVSLESACASGFYSTGGLEACLPCPAGYQCSDATASPVQCTAGTYAANTSTACSSCDAGYKCPSDGLEAQIACPTGWYQTNNGQTSCTQCPQGEKEGLKFLSCLILFRNQ